MPVAPEGGSSADGLAGRMARVVPGGVDSNVRLEVASTFFTRGEGARVWDVDGRESVDHVLGQGPAFLGHGRRDLHASVTAAIAGGMTFAAQTPTELHAAELLVDTLGWPAMVRIGMTSTETVQAALRVARAATGRKRFLRFRGHYHGWLDDVLMDWTGDPPRLASEGQVPEVAANGITVEWNDLDAVRAALDAHDGSVAAIITEPMMLNAGAIEPVDGYLRGLRVLCDELGIVLIFDETITGFRIDLRGAVGRYGVVPDLAVYGKAVAGGYPASVLAGRRDLMERFATGVNHSGTFNANVLSVAAIRAALGIMRAEAVHDRVTTVGSALMTALRGLFARRGLPLVVRGVPAAFHVAFDTDAPVRAYRALLRAAAARYRALAAHARASGIWLAGRGIWYVSAAHDADTTTDVLARLDAAIDAFLVAESPVAG
ncbi:MAG: aspartate aminotransferase family protein [Chloroflexota bacterium]